MTDSSPSASADGGRTEPAERGSPLERDLAGRAGVTVLVCDHRGEGTLARSRLLGQLGYSVLVSATLRRSLEMLAHSPPALVVLDSLAGLGQAEFEVVDRARRADGRTALLAVVADDGPSTGLLAAVRGERHGPIDLVHRGASDEELAVRVEMLLRRIETRSELERLQHLATHDDRTDLLRPQVFQEQLRQHFSAAQRHQLDLGLLLLDLDDFGRINKLYDHTVGDEVIARVGAAVRRSLRAEDVAARLGGDEFCVLLPYTRKVDAARVVQRLLEQIPEATRELKVHPPLVVTASLGFETFNGEDVESEGQMRQHAEEALRHAKRSGGDRGVYYRSLDSALRAARGA